MNVLARPLSGLGGVQDAASPHKPCTGRLVAWRLTAADRAGQLAAQRQASECVCSAAMDAYVCVTCGVQHAPSERPPAYCAICEDERQYVGWEGQQWTTLEDMHGRYRNVLEELEPDLLSIGTEPEFAIGQHALLVKTPIGNVLWDCISYIDDQTVLAVNGLGGIAAIAISHPHFYGSCIEWSDAFDAPILLPSVDRPWVMRPSRRIRQFAGDEIEPLRGTRVIRLGGHFHGSTVLLWPAGAEGRGALLTGDTIGTGVMDRRYVTFMYSYPNRIPLPAETVRDIADRVGGLAFDRIYGAWPGDVIASGAKESVRGVGRPLRRHA